MVLLQEMGLGFILTVFPTIGNNCRVQGKNCHTILRFKQGSDRRRSTMGKSLRFTIHIARQIIRVSRYGDQSIPHPNHYLVYSLANLAL